MEWYIRKGIALHKDHFIRRAVDSGDLVDPEINEQDVKQLLLQKIEDISMEAVREDVVRFIADEKKLALWSKQYFMDLVAHLRIV